MFLRKSTGSPTHSARSLSHYSCNGYDDLQLLVYRHISLIKEHLGNFSNKKLIQNEEKINWKENEIKERKVQEKLWLTGIRTAASNNKAFPITAALSIESFELCFYNYIDLTRVRL